MKRLLAGTAVMVGFVAMALTILIADSSSADSRRDQLAKSVSGAHGGGSANCERPESVEWWWCETGEDSFLGLGSGVYEGNPYIVQVRDNDCWRGLPAFVQDTSHAHIVVERGEELRGCIGDPPEGDVGPDPDVPLSSTVIARGKSLLRP